jgi:outer membrane protein TolC
MRIGTAVCVMVLVACAPVARAEDAAAAPAFDLSAALRQGETPMDASTAAARAVATAPSIARARAAGDRAREVADAAMWAVYPRLDLQASYTRLSDQDPARFAFTLTDAMGNSTTMTGTQETPLLDQYALQARLSYPLTDLFFQILPRYRAAQDTAEVEGWNEKARAREVDLQAREAFYEYARARAALEVARSGLAQSEAQRRDVEALVTGGTLARVELLRAEAQVAAAKVTIARAEGSVAIARTTLRSLLHQEGESEIGVAEDLMAPAPAVTESKADLLAQALRERSELRALRSLADAQDESVSASDGEKLPDLSLDAVYDLGNPNLQRGTIFEREWVGSWALMGILRWSPNDFVVAGARAGASRAERAQTIADVAALEDALRREVARAYEDHQAARAALDAAKVGIAAAEESYRVRREQFRAGAAVATDMVYAEAELRRARLELINAAIDIRIARSRLDRALERG